MLTFLHISDTHISGDPDYNPPWISDAVPHPNRGVEALLESIQRLPFKIDFILHSGDVCADPHEEDYHCARELLLQLEQPIYMLPGNHDSGDLMADILHDGHHLHVLRDKHVQIAGHHLIALDTNGDGDAHAPYLPDEQITWFERCLDEIGDQPIIVAMHHAPVETGVPWIDDHMRVQNGGRIQSLLQQHTAKLAGVFFGHIHQPVSSYNAGVLYVCCPSTWSNLAGYPGLSDAEPDPSVSGGYNLVMIRDQGTFVRRYSLPRITR